MFSFVIRKISSKKWLMACLFTGAVLLIAIAACNPMYTHAALQKTLTDELEIHMKETNKYPGIIEVKESIGNLGMLVEFDTVEKYFDDYETNAEKIASLYTHEAIEKVTLLKTDGLYIEYTDKVENIDDEFYVSNLDYSVVASFATLFNIEEHINIVQGELYSSEPNDEYYECIISERMLINTGMIVGSTFNVPFSEKQIKITGVFAASEEEDLYWVNDPNSYRGTIFMTKEDFCELFMDHQQMMAQVTCSYYSVFDYQTIDISEIDDFIKTDNIIRDYCQSGGMFVPDFYFEDTFIKYQNSTNNINITLLVFQIPVLVLLCAFIFMVSNQIISIEQSEIAMLKSRGVSKHQLVSAYIMQNSIISAIALIAGLPLGWMFCNIFGATKSFMEFYVRSTINVKITAESVLYALIASLVAIMIMSLPVFKYANFSIVEQKTNKKKHNKPLWQRVFLDFIILIVSLYGFYTFERRQESIIEDITSGNSIDPLIYFCSTGIILAMALILLRIIPLVSKLVYKIGEKKWNPACFAAFMQINKNIKSQSFIIVFLILTPALGVFNSTAARSINDTEEMRLKYDIGSNLVVQQEWQNNASFVDENEQVEYYEPDFTVYNELYNKVDGMTKVILDEHAGVTIDGEVKYDAAIFMAVTTNEFAKTAFVPDGNLKYKWYESLNALAQNPYGAVVSSNYAKISGLNIGDQFKLYRNDPITGYTKPTLTLSVVAIVDVWPGYESSVLGYGEDGNEVYIENYLVVANYNTAQNVYSIPPCLEPYQLWVSSSDTSFFYTFAEEKGLKYTIFEDYFYEADEQKEQPFFQVVGGMLTIAFLIVLILSLVGFLIYWVASIKSRELLFGIYRAMGLSMKEILHMLTLEHIFSSIIPILYGIGTGLAAAKIYVPLIQLTYSAKPYVLKAVVVTGLRDMAILGISVLIMLVICFAVIGGLLSKLKIAQALKLGED